MKNKNGDKMSIKIQELTKAVYQGYATQKQAIELIEHLKDTINVSKQINYLLGINNDNLTTLNKIQEINNEIKYIEEKYKIK